MVEESAHRRRGRPKSGITPKRNIRMGATWERGEELASRLGITMTAYVEEALARHNAKVERDLRKESQA